MPKKVKILTFLMAAAIAMSGCTAAVIGTAMVGTGAGTYLFVSGELKTDYYYSYDKVWSAAEKTVAEMRGTDVAPDKGISRGNIQALINGERVVINVTYKDKNITTVGIRVGVIGDEAASRLIHGNIMDRLKK